MKEHTININYRILSEGDLCEADRNLIEQAKEATRRSYSPYSHFAVGAAALLENGLTFCGANQENAAFPSGLCAERCVLFYAGANCPDVPVTTLAVAARKSDGNFTDEPIPPCGSCRQVLAETQHRGGKPIRILLYGTKGTYEIEGVESLLPFMFTDDNMKTEG